MGCSESEGRGTSREGAGGTQRQKENVVTTNGTVRPFGVTTSLRRSTSDPVVPTDWHSCANFDLEQSILHRTPIWAWRRVRQASIVLVMTGHAQVS